MPEIIIPRSDASAEWWPEGWITHQPWLQNDALLPEKLGPDHPRMRALLAKAGSHVAAARGLPNAESYQLSELPDGYALFLMKRKTETGTTAGKIKAETAIFGSRNAQKFRTFPEFLLHVDWLLDTSHDLQDHSTCKCKKSPPPPKVPPRPPPATATADAEGSGRKRKNTDTVEPEIDSRKRSKENHAATQADIDEETRQYAKEMMATDQDRRRDLRIKRFFRKGELVWVRLPWILSRPAEFHQEMGMGIESLNVWPAIILSAEYTARVGKRGEVLRYDIKFCGPLDNRGSPSLPNSLFAHVDEPYIFPFSAFDYKQYLTAMEDALNVIAPAFLEGELGLADSSSDWKARYTENLSFKSLTNKQQWDRTLIAFAQAVKFSYELAEMWTQTDGYIGQVEGEEDLRTYFLGMWWGAERIWQDELVRLVKTRSQINLPGLEAPDAKSNNGAVFLKISAISVRESDVNRKTWQTILNGDLYELKSDDSELKPDVTSVSPSTQTGANAAEVRNTENEVKPFVKPGSNALDLATALPAPPKGFFFHKLNPENTEVTCDAFDIAGRFYQGLEQTAWGMQIRSGDTSGDPNATSSPDRILSLAGKAPGKKAMLPTSTWVDTRYKSIMVAHIATRKWLAGFFVE